MIYINYQQMSPQQRQLFNKTGYADKEYVISKSEWEDMLEKLAGHQQAGKEKLTEGEN